MEGAFGAPRRHRRPVINITSLIDVMFLLLIFFMLTTTFREQMGIDVALPEAATAAASDAVEHEITVRDTGELYFRSVRVDWETLRAELESVLRDAPGAPIVLRADKAAEFQDVVRVMDLCRSVGGLQLIIPTHPLEPAP